MNVNLRNPEYTVAHFGSALPKKKTYRHDEIKTTCIVEKTINKIQHLPTYYMPIGYLLLTRRDHGEECMIARDIRTTNYI